MERERTTALGAALPRIRTRLARLGPYAAVPLAAWLYAVAVPPHGWWAAAWAVPGVLLVPARTLGVRRAALAGVVFGVLAAYGTVHWAIDAALVYFDFARWRAAAFLFGVWLVYVGTSYGALLAGYAWATRRLAPVWWPLVAGWLWAATEWARATCLLGLPWLLLGHTQARVPTVIQIADLGGVYAVTAVVVATSVALAEAVAAWPRAAERRRLVAVGAAVAASTLTYGRAAFGVWDAAPAADATRTVAVVQADAHGDFRWSRGTSMRTIARYAGLTARVPAPVDLVVWPENAVDVYLDREPLLAAQLARLAAAARDGLLLGAPRLDDDGNARNAAWLLGPDGAIRGVYDKHHLLPFAEYAPLGAGRADGDGPRYAPGTTPRPLDSGSMRLGTFICWDGNFAPLVRGLVRDGAQVLVALSNDAWLDYGGHAGPLQHFDAAVFRAVETRRWLVRAATTGVSGVVAPSGALRAVVPMEAADVVTAPVGLSSGRTPYVRFGDAWLAVGGFAIAAGVAWQRAGRAA